MFRSTRSKRGAVLAALLAVVGLVTAGVAYALLTQIPVLTGTPDQSVVAAEGNILAWARNSSANNGPYNTYVRVGSGAIRQVNPANTQAWPGGLSGDRLIYQQSRSGNSDLLFYNVVTHTQGVVPKGWNTPVWEWAPTISGHYVLFGRKNFSTHRYVILLGDLATGNQKLLAETTSASADVIPGQVNGNYATWTTCPNLTECDVYEYNITSGATSKVSNTFPTGKFQYNSAVASNGTVYFAHAQPTCGAGVTLNKRVLGSPRATIASMPSGVDIGDIYVDDSSATPAVYFTRHNCLQKQADIYKVIDK